MEKYILILLLLAMILFSLCTFPVFSLKAENVYAVCASDEIADRLFTYSPKWQTKEYYVYKIDAQDENKAKILPNGLVVKEYFSSDHNNIFTSPFMQKISYETKCVLGIPYVID